MKFTLPKVGKKAIEFTHFPTLHQSFIFRAYEYVPAKKLAEILNTTEENIHNAAKDMGLPRFEPQDMWLKKGYITIIRRMWHILPYEQLFELLETDAEKLAVILREEDFLDIKLSDKPYCERVTWKDLTESEKKRTEEIKAIVEKLDFSGKKPFEFEYSVPKISFSGKENFETRILYLFSGLYQNAFEVDSEIYCSDELLEAYSRLGINGVWTQGVLTQLTEFPFAPEISKGYEQRICRMRSFTERLSKYGIKLYLYLNEPRYMPNSFFEKHPHLKGHSNGDNSCLCTSTKEVREYLENAVSSLCKAVPELGGFITITRSENLTNCYSRAGENWGECNCPRCKDKTPGQVISDVIGCMANATHKAAPSMKFFAWSWAWNEASEDIISRLPEDVILLSQSELHIPFEIGGVKDKVVDYSMSITGPGERAKNEWALASKYGLETGAKVQINTTWEASTVPALPVFPSVEKHIKDIKEENVKHLLLSWTLGGYPCANVAYAAKYFYENCDFEGDSKYLSAQQDFAKAFKEFPFNITVLYHGPQNAGPSNLLFEKPTGYRGTMTCFAYDDLEMWRSIYPEDVFEKQFEKLCSLWKKGLEKLDENDDGETAVMARGAYCLFASSLNQIRFVRARNSGKTAECAKIAKNELEIAKTMLSLMNKNAAIGFEAANHYYFSKGQLAEKIVNCHYIIEKSAK